MKKFSKEEKLAVIDKMLKVIKEYKTPYLCCALYEVLKNILDTKSFTEICFCKDTSHKLVTQSFLKEFFPELPLIATERAGSPDHCSWWGWGLHAPRIEALEALREHYL